MHPLVIGYGIMRVQIVFHLRHRGPRSLAMQSHRYPASFRRLES